MRGETDRVIGLTIEVLPALFIVTLNVPARRRITISSAVVRTAVGTNRGVGIPVVDLSGHGAFFFLGWVHHDSIVFPDGVSSFTRSTMQSS